MEESNNVTMVRWNVAYGSIEHGMPENLRSLEKEVHVEQVLWQFSTPFAAFKVVPHCTANNKTDVWNKQCSADRQCVIVGPVNQVEPQAEPTIFESAQFQHDVETSIGRYIRTPVLGSGVHYRLDNIDLKLINLSRPSHCLTLMRFPLQHFDKLVHIASSYGTLYSAKYLHSIIDLVYSTESQHAKLQLGQSKICDGMELLEFSNPRERCIFVTFVDNWTNEPILPKILSTAKPHRLDLGHLVISYRLTRYDNFGEQEKKYGWLYCQNVGRMRYMRGTMQTFLEPLGIKLFQAHQYMDIANLMNNFNYDNIVRITSNFSIAVVRQMVSNGFNTCRYEIIRESDNNFLIQLKDPTLVMSLVKCLEKLYSDEDFYVTIPTTRSNAGAVGGH